MDVKAAYWHPKIDKEVYLQQPIIFEDSDSYGNKSVFKFKKSILGLNQAVKNWYQDMLFISEGF